MYIFVLAAQIRQERNYFLVTLKMSISRAVFFVAVRF